MTSQKTLALIFATMMVLLGASRGAQAQSGTDGAKLKIYTSAHTIHFHPDPEHVNRNNLFGIELQVKQGLFFGADRALWGAATFRNSFGQPSQLVYWGQLWDFNERFYGKMTAGFLHGYKGKYRDKIPFNGSGVAPVILPSLGMRFGPVSVEGVMLGLNGLMINATYSFQF